MPGSCIEMPIWELLKTFWSKRKKRKIGPFESAMCGAISGAIVGCLTTPLDVAKTRIMLAEKGTFAATSNILLVKRMVWREKGIQGLFAGMVPRVVRISLGSYIFFAVYEIFISDTLYN
ncbi:mitochondrial S-adenosylmethionine carrier protein-like [Saccoglossus kowalevskii]